MGQSSTRIKTSFEKNGVGLLARAPSLHVPISLQKGEALPPLIIKSVLPEGLDESYRHFFSGFPFASASIRNILLPFQPKTRGLVFLIQDVHRNLEAQSNIARVVTSLIQPAGGAPAVSMVGLEGAFRPYDLSWLRSFPDSRATQIAAEELLAQDRISGPLYALLTASHPIPPVIGIDNMAHYNANLDAYRRSLPLTSAQKNRVEALVRAIDDKKRPTYNPTLMEFDQEVQNYHGKIGSLGSYARALNHPEGPPVGKSLALFLRAIDLEKEMDFSQVEIERNRILDSLSRQLNQHQTNALLSQSLAYRSGQISYSTFYRDLLALCEEVGIVFADFPAMERYVRYVLLAESINAESLFHECLEQEQRIYTLLAKSEPEQTLIEQSHRLTLESKLLDFSLTPGEWENYRLTYGKRASTPEMKSFESFYVEAHERDTLMAENILQALPFDRKSAPPPVAIVVAGGYHAPGLTERLRQKGMAVVTVVPKISKVDTDQGSAYLSVFAQEKTPLEKLFEGSTLFVADNPMSPGAAALQAVGSVAAATSLNQPLTEKCLLFLEKYFNERRGVRIPR